MVWEYFDTFISFIGKHLYCGGFTMFFSPQYMKFHFCFTIVGQLYCHTANIAKVDMLIFCKWFRRKFSQIFWLNSHMASLADQISFEIFVDNICQNICWQYLPEYLLTIFARIFVDNICQNICWQYLPKSLLTIFARIFGRIFVDTGIAEAGPALEAGGGADASAASATCLSPSLSTSHMLRFGFLLKFQRISRAISPYLFCQKISE